MDIELIENIKNIKTTRLTYSASFARSNRIDDANLPVNLVRFSIIEINSMSHSETTLMAQTELAQLLQFRNLEMTEESLLLLFPKLIRIDEDCRVTSLLLRLFPSVKFRNDPST